MDPEGPRRIQKDPERHSGTQKDPGVTRRTQKYPVNKGKLVKQLSHTKASQAASTFEIAFSVGTNETFIATILTTFEFAELDISTDII